MQELKWIKCNGGSWCSLATLNLAHPHFDGLEGVYVIWHGGPSPKTVYVGQGNIRDRLSAHRHDKDILMHSLHRLFVTWAKVDSNLRLGTERYLAEMLVPLVGSSHPRVASITASLPW